MIEEFSNFLSKEYKLDSSGNTNPTDYERFFDLQEQIDRNMEQVNRERVLQERRRNLHKWISSLPSRWKNASLQRIDNPAAKEIEEKLKQYPNGSFYLRGGPGVGKTYLAYATLRRMIGHGKTTPSRIKVVSEETVMGYSKEGFRGRDQFNKLFNDLYNVYVFDNIGSKQFYDEKEISFWEQLIEHVYSNSLTAIFVSPVSASRFSKILSASTKSKLGFLIDDRIINVEGSKPPQFEEVSDIDILENFEG